MTNLRNENLENIIKKTSESNNTEHQLPDKEASFETLTEDESEAARESSTKATEVVNGPTKIRETAAVTYARSAMAQVFLGTNGEDTGIDEYIVEGYDEEANAKKNHTQPRGNPTASENSSVEDEYDDYIYRKMQNEKKHHKGSRKGTSSSSYSSSHHHHRHHHGKGHSGSHSSSKKYTRESIKAYIKKAIRAMCIVIVCLIAFVVGSFYLLKYMGMQNMMEQSGEILAPEIDGVTLRENGRFVEYNGHKYKYNENITNILFIGVDKTELGLIDDVVGTGGQADAVYLAAVDIEKGTITTLGIPRETMVDINEYTESGEYMGTANRQICLAYAYGDGKVKSCENLITSVQRLFYGININSYIAMDLAGISVLNDEVGGIEVKLNCDMTLNGEKYLEGDKVHLWGKNAETFVRSRSHTEIDANISRMDRQKIYLNEYVNKLVRKTREEISTPLDIYNVAKNYAISNIGASGVTFLATEFLQSGITKPNIQLIPGETVMGETYAEFYTDEKAFYEQFLSVFYTQVE